MSWFRPRDHNVFANLGSLILCGLIAGVVVAAAFFPGVALSGLMAKESLEQFDQLPSELTTDDGPQISYLYAADGKKRIAAMYDENRRNVPLHDISPLMMDAIIAAEDNNFYEHNGVDVRGIARAFVANTAADQVTQGASTITQQYVRLSLTYFSENLRDVVEATEETTGRKLREARYAIALEQEKTKDEIMNGYLNLAYFGEGAYGVFAASQVYFDKRPANLELHEAAFLAGLVQSPSDFTPTTEEGRQAATERRNWVLDQMVETKAITQAQAAEAKAIEIDIQPERQPNMCVGVSTNHWGFFCDYFYRWWLEQEEFGATKWEREQRLRGGGFHIVTSLDVKAQKATKKRVEQYLETGDKRALMLAAVEPGTGKVRAMATNRRFAIDDAGNPDNGPHSDPDLRAEGLHGTYPKTTNPLISGGGDIDGYQAGSIFKLFTMLAALEEGLPLDYSLHAPYRVTTRFPVESGPASCGGQWCPVNFSESVTGRHNMWTGFGQSVNTFFAQLIEQVGPDKTVDVAERLGIKFRARGTEENPQDAQFSQEPRVNTWGAFTLGVSATTPLDVASAFAAVSAEGRYCEPSPVEEIRTKDGESLDLAKPDCRQAIDKNVARAAIDAGRCVVGAPSKFGKCPPWGTAGRITGTDVQTTDVIDAPLWGKSGTTDGDKTAALALSTSELAMVGILADPDWAQTTQKMDHNIVNPAVTYALADAMKGRDGRDWKTPTDKQALGDQIGIPSVQCRSVDQARSILQQDGFRVSVSGTRVDSPCPEGTAAGTSPSGRTVRGGAVTIQVSNGSGFQENGNDNGDGNDNGNGNRDGNGDDDDEGGNGNGGGLPLPLPSIEPPPGFEND